MYVTDLFQGYQPFQPTRHTTRRPDYNIYPQENNRRKTKDDESYTNNDRQIKEQTPRPSHSHETSRQTYRQTNKRKHTTIAPILNLNFFTTPATTRKKNSNRRAFDTNTRSRETESIENLYKREQNSNYDNKNQFYDETLNNIVNDYQTTRATTTKRITTTKINHGSKRNNANTRPNYATTKTYYDANRPSNGANSFSTLRPGVRPANVDLSKPPITNKPPSLAVYPRPTDSSVIRFPEDPDTSPEVISGPDEDKMSHAEKRKYIDVAEKSK
ncbi:unnamed protein product [Diatraea saccharalis]|uniref:Uncharacterized protein n=1 Tax=Diatraea saccharalis TaxID=40085 RepID=A0A9N9R6H0_9NEOP|nr:unnamed protein product [Diatraea saccharalis]